MLIKCLRIHHEPDNQDSNDYEVYDRYGKFHRTYHQPIKIINAGNITYFGFCPIETDDITLEFEKPIDSSQIVINRD